MTTAVPAPPDSPDAGVPWHYGDPHREQRRLVDGTASVDLGAKGVVTVSGADRLTWLDDLTTQGIATLAPGDSTLALILSPHGHVEHELHVVDDGDRTWLLVEPGTSAELTRYLRSMQFLLRVDVSDVSEEMSVVWEPTWTPDDSAPTWLMSALWAAGDVGSVAAAGSDRGGDATRYVASRPALLPGREVVVRRTDVDARLGDDRAGTWALEALRVAAAVPRLHHETDHRTLPHEVGWVGPAVRLGKGCYRGQEAVARVHNLGHPPRRLVLAHLDGSGDHLPAHGDAVVVGDVVVGWIGTAAWHHELGPIGTAVVKRTAPDGQAVVRTSDGEVAASLEPVVAA